METKWGACGFYTSILMWFFIIKAGDCMFYVGGQRDSRACKSENHRIISINCIHAQGLHMR